MCIVNILIIFEEVLKRTRRKSGGCQAENTPRFREGANRLQEGIRKLTTRN